MGNVRNCQLTYICAQYCAGESHYGDSRASKSIEPRKSQMYRFIWFERGISNIMIFYP